MQHYDVLTKVLLHSCFLMECIGQTSTNEHYTGIHIRTTQEKKNSPSSSLNF